MSNVNKNQGSRFSLNEDWLALIIAFVVILLSVVGLLGPNGLKIAF
jgi:hypothetical protein